MSNYFQNFPLVGYKFGNEPTFTPFQNISAYNHIIDEVIDDTSFYTTYTIEDGDRPDVLSYKLYGTVDYYWTFYFLNNDIRESGWPLSNLDVFEKAKTHYPHRVVTTKAGLGQDGEIADIFLVGDRVRGVTTSTNTGVVVRRNLDLGQIVLTTTDNYRSERVHGTGELIEANEQTAARTLVFSDVEQFNAVHHYENSAGEPVDINPITQDTTGLIPITYLDRMIAKNDELKEIKAFKPGVVTQINAEWQKLLLRG